MSKSVMVSWKPGSRLSSILDAEQCHKEIEAIRESCGGDFTAADIVERARDESSPLHRGFEWDDTAAAHEHRLSQARKINRSIQVKYLDLPNQPETRAYEVKRVEVSSDGTSSRKFFSSSEEVMNDPDSRARLITEALNELQRLRVRFRLLQELSIVWRSVDEVLEKHEA